MEKIVELTQVETKSVVGGAMAERPQFPLLRLFALFIRRIIGGGKPVVEK